MLRDPELRPDQDHVHRQPPAAALDEELLGRRHHLGRRLPRLVRGEERLEAVLVDPDALAHRLQLGVALDRAREVELGVEGDEVEALEGAEVAHGHDVVEPVDADPPPAAVARRRGDLLAGPVVEDLLELRRPVLADVARLGREDDLRLAVRRHDDVGVAVHDLEAGEVRDRALEAGVLAAGDDQRVQLVLRHRGADVGVPARQFCVHEASTPLIRATTASLSGVGTPCSRPKRTMPPLSQSTSVGRRASTSCSIDALCP